MRYFLIVMCLMIGFSTGGFAQEGLFVQNAVKSISLAGYTRSNRTATVSSEVSGKITKVNYDVGQTIGEQPFFEIDPTFIDLEIKSTQQSLNKMDVALKQSASKVEYLKKEYQRIEILHKGDRATEVKRDAAKEEYEQSELAHESLELDQSILKTRLAELIEKKARYRVMAHKGWVVVRKIAEIGEIVAPGAQLARIADFQSLVIPLSVSTAEYEAIKAKSERFDARLEGKSIRATLAWVNPEFNEQTRKLSIEIRVVDYDEVKRGGLQFDMSLDMNTQGLSVPKKAVTDRYDNPKVTVKDSGKSIRILVLGENNGDLLIADNPLLKVGTELLPQP